MQEDTVINYGDPHHTVLDANELTINMGPQHPSTHGVLRVKLKVDGERVTDLECVIGYLHRGVEKLCENETFIMVPPHLDRTDYIAAVSNCLGYVEAIEKLMGMEVPRRAEYARVLLTEFNRISSHLLWLGTHALDLGAMTVFLYAFREREEILKLFEMHCGARLTTHMFRIGGLHADLPARLLKKAMEFCKTFEQKVDDYEGLLTENRIWQQRTKGVGIISGPEAIDLGLTGPPLRGCGVAWDLRRALPYSAYPEFKFEIPVGETGDTYDRYIVRMRELRQSNRIIMQAIEGLPEGPVMGKVPKVIKPPVGEIYHGIEAPKGELGYYVVSDGTTRPYRVRIRPPSFVNLQALKRLTIGHMIADVVALIGTIDIVLGEVDR